MSRKSLPKLQQTADVLPLLNDIANHRQEHFVVLSLDSRWRLIEKRIVFIGTVSAVLAHPREVFAGAMADAAEGIIVAHNHPSGDPSPSEQDISMTQQLVAAGQILGIRLYDHIIISEEGYFSFQAKGLLLLQETFQDYVNDSSSLSSRRVLCSQIC